VVRGFVGWRVAVYTPLLDIAVDTATSAFDVAVALRIYRRALYVALTSYQFGYFIMEPTFSSAASVTTVTPVLAAQIQAAIAALPAAHRAAP
jgi:hypothetical protein